MFIAFGKNHHIVLPNLALTSTVPTHVNDMRLAPDLNGRPVFFTSEGYKVDAGHFGGGSHTKTTDRALPAGDQPPWAASVERDGAGVGAGEIRGTANICLLDGDSTGHFDITAAAFAHGHSSFKASEMGRRRFHSQAAFGSAQSISG